MRRREIALHFVREVRVLGHVGIEQVLAQPDLAVGQHDGELGTREAAACLRRSADLIVGRQELDGAVQRAAPLQRADRDALLGSRSLARACSSTDSAWLCR